MILGAYRDADVDQGEELSEVLSALGREAGLERVHLGRVDRAASAELIRALAPSATPELIAGVAEEADGNPFFIRELVITITEERDGYREPDNMAGLGLATRVPEGIKQVIERRLRRLTLETRAVLTTASAITGPLHVDLISAASDLGEPSTLQAFDEAMSAQLLRPSPDGESCEFAHALIRHTLYASMSPPRRARTHRRIAEAIERTVESDEFAADLAYHYRRSITLPNAARGCKYALIVAEEARRANAPERVVEFLRIANELAGRASVSQRADIVQQLAIAEGLAMRAADAASTARFALQLLDQAQAESSDIVAFLAAFTRAQKNGGAPRNLWEPFAFKGLELKREDHDLEWARLTLLFNPFETVSTGLIHAARSVGYEPEAVAIARTLGDEDDFLSTLGITEVRTREETKSVRDVVGGWSGAHRREGLCIVGHDLLNRHGEFREARELFKAIIADEHTGSISSHAFAWIQLAVAEAALGAFTEAQKAASSAEALIRRLPTAHIARFYEYWLSFVLAYYLDGDWRTISKFGIPLASYHYAILTAPLFAAQVALANVRIGDVEVARRYLTELVGVLERTGAEAWHQHGAVIVAADAIWELAHTAEARVELAPMAARYRTLAQELVERDIGDIAIGSLSLTVARLNVLTSDYRPAEFERARADATRCGQLPLRAIVDHDEAKAMIAVGAPRERALALLDDAAERFQGMRLEWWANRTQHMKQHTGRTASPTGLTPREIEVLQLLASGMSSGEIARELTLSVRTVGRHITNIYAKINARGRADATAYAIRHLPARPMQPT
jgi:DNA-binding CsgD family transcriptional regulator